MSNNAPFGSKILEQRHSEINGDIKVVKSLGLGTYIQVEGLTQSGGVVSDVWEQTLKKIKSQYDLSDGQRITFKNCLILGFGGGSAGKLVEKYFPGVRITGVDIDPLMIDLGRKYLNLGEYKVVIKDAMDFVEEEIKYDRKYDLILVDTYLGQNYPEKFEKISFVNSIGRILKDNGIAVFNRLYWDEKKDLAHEFEKRLEEVFDSVDRFYPEANLMLICRSD